MGTLLTVEEAVALMINMDFIPEGETVFSMTEAYFEEADVEYFNYHDHDQYRLKALENRMKACGARRDLAVLLKKSLIEDALYTEDTLLECDEDKSTTEQPIVTLASLSDWASDRFGITIPNKVTSAHENPNPSANIKVLSWDDVTIKIYADYKLGYSIGNGNFKRTSFMAIGLMGKHKLLPNNIALILIGLSNKKKYPVGPQPSPANKTAMAKLRVSLGKLTGLTNDAFLPFNKIDGYKPKFTLVDDRKNADERAEREAIHVSFDDHGDNKYSFAREDDDADAYIEEQS